MKHSLAVLFCILLVAFAKVAVDETTSKEEPVYENSLEDDARTPSGFTEKVVLLQRDSDITKFESLYKRLPGRKGIPPSRNNTNLCGAIKQQSTTPELTDVGCGSCTTFAVIACAEVAYNVATKKTEIFSEMDIVDCMYHAGGCNGNVVQHAIMHVFNNGVATNSEYPYEPHDKKVCNQKPTRLHKHKFVPFIIDSKNPQQWKYFLKLYGAFALQYYSGTWKFSNEKKNYSNVVVTDCDGAADHSDSINHAVSVVGYGKLDGEEYFLVRNSWGVDAGEHDYGYFKLKVGACNSQVNNFFGFVFDQCEDYKDKNSCVSHHECNYNGLTKKCNSAFKKWTTAALDVAENVANFADSVIDKIDGIGINDLPKDHALRKNGTEFFCYLKSAGKTGNEKTVDKWFDKCIKANAIKKSDGTILNHAAVKKTLGLIFSVTTHVATKAHDDNPSKANSTNWYSLIKKALSKKYYDPRYNRVDKAELHTIIGTTKEGKFTWESETAGGFGWDDLTETEKKIYSVELVCYTRGTGKRERNILVPLLEKLAPETYKYEEIDGKVTKEILDYTKLKAHFGIKAPVSTYSCESGDWYLKEKSGKYWNCKTNEFAEKPEDCTAFTPKKTEEQKAKQDNKRAEKDQEKADKAKAKEADKAKAKEANQAKAKEANQAKIDKAQAKKNSKA